MAELNGRPVSLDELQTLALTNYGHFTSFRIDDGRVRGLPLHLERLNRDCQALFGVSLDAGHLRDLVRSAAPKQGAATIRVTVFDPTTDLGRPASARDPHVLVTHRQAAALPLSPLSVQTCTFLRDTPQVKSVGLFGTLRQRRLAQLNGFDDALFADATGLISEGGTWNVGFIDGTQIIWPDAPCLPGVTMRLLHDPSHRVLPVRLEDLNSMEGAFATNAAIGVRAITRINNVTLPEHSPALDILRKEYLNTETTFV
ncbi:aminotransferase class IV family protein [Actinoplanes sp. NPDC051346]|uniref:aminotransferase class IV family protein n=1 Tax=Actinoplanes sp. NPDC051346 TaxID=3155048 RepID=UPI00341FA90D